GLILVDRIDAIDLCLFVLAARDGYVEEGLRADFEAFLIERQIFGGLRGGLRQQLNGLALRFEREVRLRYVGRDLKVSGAYVEGRVVTLHPACLEVLLAHEAVEQRQGDARAYAIGRLGELPWLVLGSGCVELRIRCDARSATQAGEACANAQRV